MDMNWNFISSCTTTPHSTGRYPRPRQPPLSFPTHATLLPGPAESWTDLCLLEHGCGPLLVLLGLHGRRRGSRSRGSRGRLQLQACTASKAEALSQAVIENGHGKVTWQPASPFSRRLSSSYFCSCSRSIRFFCSRENSLSPPPSYTTDERQATTACLYASSARRRRSHTCPS